MEDLVVTCIPHIRDLFATTKWTKACGVFIWQARKLKNRENMFSTFVYLYPCTNGKLSMSLHCEILFGSRNFLTNLAASVLSHSVYSVKTMCLASASSAAVSVI